MNIYLGNVTFNSIFKETGYKLTKEDKKIWDKYHSNKADLSEKHSCFHIFSMPLEIHFKGDEALDALLKMFTSDKCVESKGQFNVIRKE
jgi:predicted amidohydrolase YtcJ